MLLYLHLQVFIFKGKFLSLVLLIQYFKSLIIRQNLLLLKFKVYLKVPVKKYLNQFILALQVNQNENLHAIQ